MNSYHTDLSTFLIELYSIISSENSLLKTEKLLKQFETWLDQQTLADVNKQRQLAIIYFIAAGTSSTASEALLEKSMTATTNGLKNTGQFDSHYFLFLRTCSQNIIRLLNKKKKQLAIDILQQTTCLTEAYIDHLEKKSPATHSKEQLFLFTAKSALLNLYYLPQLNQTVLNKTDFPNTNTPNFNPEKTIQYASNEIERMNVGSMSEIEKCYLYLILTKRCHIEHYSIKQALKNNTFQFNLLKTTNYFALHLLPQCIEYLSQLEKNHQNFNAFYVEENMQFGFNIYIEFIQELYQTLNYLIEDYSTILNANKSISDIANNPEHENWASLKNTATSYKEVLKTKYNIASTRLILNYSQVTTGNAEIDQSITLCHPTNMFFELQEIDEIYPIIVIALENMHTKEREFQQRKEKAILAERDLQALIAKENNKPAKKSKRKAQKKPKPKQKKPEAVARTIKPTLTAKEKKQQQLAVEFQDIYSHIKEKKYQEACKLAHQKNKESKENNDPKKRLYALLCLADSYKAQEKKSTSEQYYQQCIDLLAENKKLSDENAQLKQFIEYLLKAEEVTNEEVLKDISNQARENKPAENENAQPVYQSTIKPAKPAKPAKQKKNTYLDGQVYSINLPEKVTTVINQLKGEGFETWVVGGAVRDSFLNKKPADFDLVTTANLYSISSIISHKGNVVGKNHPVFNLDEGDIQLCQLKNNLLEDAKKRDFTCNALYYSTSKFKIFDPLACGLDDLKKKVITPIKQFEADPSLIFRAIRLTHIGMTLKKTDLNEIKNSGSAVKKMNPHRLNYEITKTLSQQKYLNKTLEQFTEFHLFETILNLPKAAIKYLCYEIRRDTDPQHHDPLYTYFWLWTVLLKNTIAEFLAVHDMNNAQLAFQYYPQESIQLMNQNGIPPCAHFGLFHTYDRYQQEEGRRLSKH